MFVKKRRWGSQKPVFMLHASRRTVTTLITTLITAVQERRAIMGADPIIFGGFPLALLPPDRVTLARLEIVVPVILSCFLWVVAKSRFLPSGHSTLQAPSRHPSIRAGCCDRLSLSTLRDQEGKRRHVLLIAWRIWLNLDLIGIPCL